MLGAILAGASLLGKLGGGGARASADGRRADAYQDAQLAAINNRAALDAAGHNLNVSQYNLQAPSVLAKRGVGASGLMNYATKGSHPAAQGFATGLQDPSVREAILGRLVGDTGEQLRTGSYKATPMAAPAPVQRQKAGMLEKIGGFAGLFGGLAGGLSELGVGKAPKLNIDDLVQGGASMPNVRFR